MDDQTPPAGLRSKIVTLAGFLRAFKTIAAPRFQRPYCWSDEHVSRLFADLRDAYRARKDHYFVGALMVIDDTPERVADIVDGQQRLATLTLLFAALRDRLKNKADIDALQDLIGREAMKLRLRGQDGVIAAEYILRPKRVAALAELAETASAQGATSGLADAAYEIEQGLAAMHASELPEFAAYLRGRVTFNLLETSERNDAARLFTVLNETGLDLTATDLVKSELFAIADLSEQDAERIGQRWDHWLARLQPHGMEELLSAMPSLTQGTVFRQMNDVAVFRRYFLSAPGARAFLEQRLPRYADAALAIQDRRLRLPPPHAAEANRRLHCLQYLTQERTWAGLAIAVTADYWDEPEFVVHFLQMLERFTYACVFNAIERTSQTDRWSAIYRALLHYRERRTLGGVLDLTQKEQSELRARMYSPIRRKDPRKRQALMRFNAALGEVLAPDANANVEHIAPQNMDDHWYKLFPDPAQRNNMTHCIGNLTLITHEQNDECANAPFSRKQQIIFDQDYPIRALSNSLRNVVEWTPARIRERADMLMQALWSDWRLNAS